MPGLQEQLLAKAVFDGKVRINSVGELEVDEDLGSKFKGPFGDLKKHLVDKDGNRLKPIPKEMEGGREIVEWVHQLRAEKEIKQAWDAQGGNRSLLSVPLPDGNIHAARNAQGDWEAQFRGGSMVMNNNSLQIQSFTHTVTRVTLVGIECLIRQESADELYGVVGLAIPAAGVVATAKFKDITLGPAGQRIVQTAIPVGEPRGLPMGNLHLLASLVEQDSGDPDEIAASIADEVAKAGAAVVGVFTGIPAESVSSNESFKAGIEAGLVDIFDGILGIGDDPYNPGTIFISYDELLVPGGPPKMAPRFRIDDPGKVIKEWTHAIELSGIDDGDDRGAYRFYFRVEVKDITEDDHG